MFKFGRYRIGFGFSTIFFQTQAPTTIRHFLFVWILKEARHTDVSRVAQFPPGTRMNVDGRIYRYYKKVK